VRPQHLNIYIWIKEKKTIVTVSDLTTRDTKQLWFSRNT
jgi:hypothetical protein